MMRLFDDSESWVTLGIGMVVGVAVVAVVAYIIIVEVIL